jgi:hypothetical protein
MLPSRPARKAAAGKLLWLSWGGVDWMEIMVTNDDQWW